MKLRLAAPTDLVDLSGIEELRASRSRQRRHHRRHDPACRSRPIRGRAGEDPGARESRRRHRRPHGAQHGHHRRLAGATTIRWPTIRRRCSASTPRSTPTSARSPRTISSRACSRPRWQAGEIIVSVSFPVPEKRRLRQVQEPGLALCHRRRARGAKLRAACALRSPAPHPACSASPKWKRRSPRIGRPMPSPASRARGQAQRRSACERRIPLASDHGDGAPRGGGGEVDAGMNGKAGAKVDGLCALCFGAAVASRKHCVQRASYL